MKKKEKGKRAFKRRALIMQVPNTVPFYTVQREDSTHVFVCTKCGARRYTDGRFAMMLGEITDVVEGQDIQVDAVLPQHRPCQSVMRMEELER